MAKFYGEVGFFLTMETKPGVWSETSVPRNYSGDVIKNSLMLQSSDQVNDNMNVSSIISILSDPFAYENFHAIRYVEYMGTKWKVPSVEVQYPRLLLTLGGVYNG